MIFHYDKNLALICCLVDVARDGFCGEVGGEIIFKLQPIAKASFDFQCRFDVQNP